jgi:hypothetical protein
MKRYLLILPLLFFAYTQAYACGGISLGIGCLSLSPTSGGESVPFTYDSDTYWFDGTWSGNRIDAVADDTIAVAHERISNKGQLSKTTKDYQLLYDANGFKGLSGDNRVNSWGAGDVSGFNNGNSGWYMAANIYVESSDYQIFSNGRASVYVPSNREIGFKHSYDGGGFDWALRCPAISYDTWYTIEILFNYSTDTMTCWYNGSSQSLAYSNAETFSPASSDQPAAISAGEGITQQVIYVDDLIASDSAIRETISTYLNEVRP